MAGPNDYNVIVGENGETSLAPGLGKDEPSEQAKAEAKVKGQAKLEAMKEELRVAHADLTEKERAVLKREEAAIRRERDLEEREKALAAKEAGAKKP